MGTHCRLGISIDQLVAVTCVGGCSGGQLRHNQEEEMRCPTIKTLTSRLCLEVEQARLVRKLAKLADDPDALADTIAQQCPHTDRWANQCRSDPYASHTWRRTMLLSAIDETIGTHGTEVIRCPRADYMAPPAFEYCNTGDLYGATIVYSRESDALRIASVGDIVERLERV